MEIDATTYRHYPPAEILAHCLWEMTFVGFDQETILGEKQAIIKRVEEIDSMTAEERKDKLIPLDEEMKCIEEWQGKK